MLAADPRSARAARAAGASRAAGGQVRHSRLRASASLGERSVRPHQGPRLGEQRPRVDLVLQPVRVAGRCATCLRSIVQACRPNAGRSRRPRRRQRMSRPATTANQSPRRRPGAARTAASSPFAARRLRGPGRRRRAPCARCCRSRRPPAPRPRAPRLILGSSERTARRSVVPRCRSSAMRSALLTVSRARCGFGGLGAWPRRIAAVSAVRGPQAVRPRYRRPLDASGRSSRRLHTGRRWEGSSLPCVWMG